MPHENEHLHPELVAPPVEKIKVPNRKKPIKIDGTHAFKKTLVMNENGEEALETLDVIYIQGYQKGWTDAGAVKVMAQEAKGEGRPDWPPLPKPKAIPPGDTAIPVPHYLASQMKAGVTQFLTGYKNGWKASMKKKAKKPH